MNNLDIKGVLGLFSLIFGFWPIMVLAPLNWRRNILSGMLYIWGFFAILRILFYLFSISPSKLVIDEPLNTIIFFISGGILLLVFIIRERMNNSKRYQFRKEKVRDYPLQLEIEKDFEPTEPKFVPLCPKCGQKMVLRTAKQGDNAGKKFWGCSNFPECRGIVGISDGK
jgi:predicted RNA-binding Zn-ribbon protein involved in translation (DUF1610 family)